VCGRHPSFSAQETAKTLAQQEEQLKKMEIISTLQESTRILKMDRDKLQQELQQAQAKVRGVRPAPLNPCVAFGSF